MIKLATKQCLSTPLGGGKSHARALKDNGWGRLSLSRKMYNTVTRLCVKYVHTTRIQIATYKHSYSNTFVIKVDSYAYYIPQN